MVGPSWARLGGDGETEKLELLTFVLRWVAQNPQRPAPQSLSHVACSELLQPSVLLMCLELAEYWQIPQGP